MNSSNLFYISVRLLFGKTFSKRWHAVIPILSIAISVVPIIVVLNVSNGMIQGIINRFLETTTYHIQAQRRLFVSEDELEEIQQRINTHPYITFASVERRGVGLLDSNTRRSGVVIRGITPQLYQENGFQEYVEVVEGSFTLSKDTILLGQHVATSLGVKTEDEVRLVTVQSIGGTSYPKITTFTVGGIVNTGYKELDSRWVFVHYNTASSVLTDTTSSDILGVKIQSPYSLPNILSRSPQREDALSALRHIVRVVQDKFVVYTWYELQQSRLLTFRATKNVLLFVSAIVICVAMVHILSILSSLTIEKRSEIAILKANGVSPNEIHAIFVASGFLIGMIAATTGILVGTLTSININDVLTQVDAAVNIITQDRFNLGELQTTYYLEDIPVTLLFWEILAIGWGVVFLSMIAAYFPAKRAAAITPLQILGEYQKY